MRSQIRAINEVHDILQRMNELAVQSANDVNTVSVNSSAHRKNSSEVIQYYF